MIGAGASIGEGVVIHESAYVDDGARVIINGVNVLDQFNANTTQNYRTFTFQQNLTANQSVVPLVRPMLALISS